MKKALIFPIFLTLLISACSKTDAPNGFNDPVFKVFFTIDTLQGDSIIAGIDGIYLFTNYTTTNENFHSVNTFADAGCPAGDCPGSLSFEFSNSVLNDTAFSGGSYRYIQLDTVSITIFNWGGFGAPYLQHIFTLDTDPPYVDSTTAQGVTYQILDMPNQQTHITLRSTAPNGVVSRLEREFIPSNIYQFPSVALIADREGDGYRVRAFNDWNGPIIEKYNWNTGDTLNAVFIDSLSNLSEVAVTVTDADGNAAIAALANLPFPITSNYRSVPLTVQSSFYFDGQIAIQWIDPEGIQWRSDLSPQPQGFSFFEVLEMEPYEPNENGLETRKLRVNFNCTLFNAAGDSRPFTGQGVIAMARP